MMATAPGAATGAESTVHRTAQRWPAYVIVCVLTIVAYAFVLQLWNADPAVSPYYAYGGDAISNLAFAKGLFARGNPYSSPLLAAPIGGASYEFPVFCAAQLPFQILLGWLTRSPSAALNWVYFLSLPAAASTALFALRRLGIVAWLAIPFAVVFSLEPRFLGGEERVDLSVFWIIPLAVLMCILVARARVVFIDRSAGRWRLTKDGWTVLVAATLTGLGNQYYAFFAVLLLGVAALIAALGARSWKPISISLGLTAIVTLGLGVQFTPTFLFQVEAGRNPLAFTRHPEEAQTYALQIASLLLPIEGHRGPPQLAAKRAFYDAHAPWALSEVYASSLGTLGSIGFLALIAAIIVRSGRKLPYDIECVALLNLAAVLIATSSGFGALFNYYVNPDIRAYNRISLFIELFALVGLAQIVMYALTRWKWRLPVAAQVLVTIGVVAFAAWDQTSANEVPPYALSASESRSDASFVAAVESQIGSGAAFELPWMRFPESHPEGTLLQGDLYRPYLYAKTLRISYGAIEGRDPFAWQKSIAGGRLADMIRSAILGGYDGFIVFRKGYVDNGVALETSLRAVLGAPLVSPDGTVAFYSAKALRDRAIALDPQIGTPWYAERMVRTTAPVLGPTFVHEPSGAVPVWYSTSPNATVLFRNSSSRTRPVAFRALVDFSLQTADLHVAGPDGQSLTVKASAQPGALDFRFDAPPGKTTFRLTTAAHAWRRPGDPQPLFIRLIDPRIDARDLDPPNPAASAMLQAAVEPIVPSDDFGSRRLRLMEGCSEFESRADERWNWCLATGTFRVESDRRERLHFSALVFTPGTPNSRLALDIDGMKRDVQIRPTGTHLDLALDAAPHKPVVIHFSTDARPLTSPDPRTLVIQFVDPRLVP